MNIKNSEQHNYLYITDISEISLSFEINPHITLVL